MVISTELPVLESVKEKLEGGKLKTEIIEKLRRFLNEGREICNLYNNEFIPEIRNLITQIFDVYLTLASWSRQPLKNTRLSQQNYMEIGTLILKGIENMNITNLMI